MTPKQTARLFDLTARPLLAGLYRRVEGDGFLAYRYAGNGAGSEVVRIDLLDDFAPATRGPAEPLPAAARKLPRAFRTLAADPETTALVGPGWKLSRAAVNAERTVTRLELQLGERHTQPFVL